MRVDYYNHDSIPEDINWQRLASQTLRSVEVHKVGGDHFWEKQIEWDHGVKSEWMHSEDVKQHEGTSEDHHEYGLEGSHE